MKQMVKKIIWVNWDSLKKILLLGAPLLLGRLSFYFHQVADSMMMGHFGKGSELAAIGMAGLFIWIINTLIWPIGNGIQAIITRRVGQWEKSETRNDSAKHELIGVVLDNGILLFAVVSTLAFLLSFTAPVVFNLLLKDQQIIQLCLDYVGIVRYGFFPLAAGIAFQRFFSSIKVSVHVMVVNLISNFVNIVLNYILIFGKLGFEPMGIQGAAWGTILSHWISLGYLLFLIIIFNYHQKYKFFRFKKIDRVMLGNMVKIALPPAIQNFIAFGIIMLFESMVETISPVYLAATHVIFSVYRINKTLVGGFGHAAAILVGNALGREDKKGAVQLTEAVHLIGGFVGAIVFVLTFFFPELLGKMFAKDPQTMDAINMAMKFFAFFYFIEIVAFPLEIVFVNNGYGKFVLGSEFISNTLFILGFTALMGFLFPGQIYLAWLGYALYQLFHAFFLHIGFYRKKWLDVQVEGNSSS